MQKFKKTIIIFTILVMSFVFSLLAEEHPSEDNLQFSVYGGKIYFFQPRTGSIFVYQITTNRFSHMLTLETLGKDLKRKGALSKIEESNTGGY